MNQDADVTKFVDKTHPFAGEKKYIPANIVRGKEKLDTKYLKFADARRA
jgi:precorrin-6x reductase